MTDRTELELKPCPFCGGRPKLLLYEPRAGVRCLDCHCQTSLHFSNAEAVSAWNTRATEQQP